MEIIIIVAGLLLFFNLRGRIIRLEGDIAELCGRATVSRGATVAQSANAVSVQASLSSEEPLPPVYMEKTSTAPHGASLVDALVVWAKEDWLLKLGAFIVLLGFGWFVSYAFAQNWIGPLGRVTLGMVLGISILSYGWSRMHTYARQGSVFLGLGATVVLISAFSSAHVYTLVSGHVALIIMFLTCAFLALASVRFEVQSLAVVGVIVASIAPSTLLLNATPSYTELFAYLFAVVLGTVWIVSITGWRNLTAVSLAMFFIYSIPHLANGGNGTLLMFAYAFALLFFVTNTIGILKIRDGDITADAVTAAGNGLLLLAWISVAASPEWKSLIMVGWMIVFIVAAFAVFAITKRKEPFFVYAGVGIAMLAAATAIDFDGAGLTIAYTIESALVPLVAYGIMRDRFIAKKLSLLIIGPSILSLQSIGANWSSTIPWEHFFALFILSGTLLLLGLFFWSLHKEDGEASLANNLFLWGSLFAYVLLWLSLHAVMDKDTATTVCLVVYTLIGLASYAYGKMNENKGMHYYGGALLAFTVGHLLLIDVWNMAMSGKIITFFLVGALLMGTAFMSKKKNLTIPQA